MVEGKDVRWSMVVNSLITDWMNFVMLSRDRKLDYEQFKLLYHHSVVRRKYFIAKNRCYMMRMIHGVKIILEKCKKLVRLLTLA